MTLALSEIFDQLPIASVNWSVQRNSEYSGTGSGDVWEAQFSVPSWTGDVTLGRGSNNELKQAAALIRSLDGTGIAFLMCDPTSLYPQADPKGIILGSSSVTLRTIGADRVTARMGGLPAGYVLTRGDKLQIPYGAYNAFVEVSRNCVADGSGNVDAPIFPRLPSSVSAGATVILAKPACPVIIQPESHNPGTASGSITDGAGFKVIQKRRA